MNNVKCIRTNRDRLRNMSNTELAEWITTTGRTFGEEYEGQESLRLWLNEPCVDMPKCYGRDNK